MDKIADLNLVAIISLFIKRIWLLIICAVIGGGVSLFIALYMIEPVYASNFTLHIYNTEQIDDKMSSADIYASQLLVPSCGVIMKSNTVLKSVADQLGDGTTVAQLKKYIKIMPIEDTNIIGIAVITPNAEKSYNTARSMSSAVTTKVSQLMRTGRLVILDEPVKNNRPYDRNPFLKACIGALIGFIIGVTIVLLLEKTDISIKGIEDIRKTYNIPILGDIPHYNQGELETSGYEDFLTVK